MKHQRTCLLAAAFWLLWCCLSAHSYTKVGNTYRTDGSQSDVNLAIRAASDGSTVEIPAGNFAWTSQTNINKAIHLKGQGSTSTNITNDNTLTDMILIRAAKGGHAEISDLHVSSPQSSIFVYSIKTVPGEGWIGKPILLHDCSFKTGFRYAVEWDVNGGVIWNCYFEGDAGGASGISFVPRSQSTSWRSASTMGKDDKDGAANTYVEDCTFKDLHIGCLNPDDNSRVVIRHNVFDNAALASHGQETSPAGLRHFELYDNTFNYTTSGGKYPLNFNYWFCIRGGTGIITGNRMPAILYGKTDIQLCVFSINRRGQIPCQTQYPAARQVGQSWKGAGGYRYPSVPLDGTGYYTDPIYIWGNTGDGPSSPTFVGLNQYTPDECGNGQKIEDYVKLNRDYVLGPKPGWVRYPYPHPLRTIASASEKKQ